LHEGSRNRFEPAPSRGYDDLVSRPTKRVRVPTISPKDYRALAAFRYELRKFLAFSEHAARAAGIEPQQHQLLLAVRGLPVDCRPTIGTIAGRLSVQHHTAVELVDKLEQRGFIARERNAADRREVLLRLTREGTEVLAALSELHRDQLKRIGPELVGTLAAIVGMTAASPGE
jgi:DNA-binding MarR family transcriptional regulator